MRGWGFVVAAVLLIPPPPTVARGRAAAPAAAMAVHSVGMTVSNMDRAVEFYTSVLTFEKTADYELSGREYELLTGVFGARTRTVELRLGGESLELTEFFTPRGRPIPADMRANDLAFQHAALIVNDMDRAYARPAAARRRACLERAATPAGLERQRRGHPRVLFPRSRRAFSRDPAVPAWQRRAALAAPRPAVPRHRSHRHRLW
jgi:catechol 2,3-dioxygenase-like lactoylglutathione lyase family enzyme